jgi:type IV pilus assembly protein PilB
MSNRIGELLVKSGLVTSEQLSKALEHLNPGATITSYLVSQGILAEQDVVETLSQHYSVPIIELEDCIIDTSLAQLIPPNLAQKHHLVPILRRDNSLTIALCDPANVSAINDIKFITGLDIQVKVAAESAIKRTFERLFEQNTSYDNLIQDIEAESIEVVTIEEEINLTDLERSTEDAPVVKLVNAILIDAIKKSASDIHLEPYERTFRVRFRIDGVLYEIMKPPPKLRNALISRLKIMSELDIAERRLPQDGRIKLRLGQNREMDFRVNVMPTLFGEKVCLRLLDKGNLQLDIEKLGFDTKQKSDFEEAIAKPHGMVLVTGPTGSGKTTTLYSALSELNKTTTNINTAEDPVEFNLAGINQAQMNEDIGFTFAAALRAFLRQDPDVIMVGEIRDYETAEIAIKASLTGHLVLSTLHTNDAPSTINRLLNMGVEPFLVASSVNLIAAQRLARRVCSHCVETVQLSPEILVDIGVPAAEARHIQVKQGKGCQRCSSTGYKGRIALYEIMPITDSLRECILNGASSTEIKRQAIKEGMLTLRASGIVRLKEGVTTAEEVLRVTSAD